MKALSQIKAISFDGDMTLWDFRKVMRHSLGIALEELRRHAPGPGADALTIDALIEIRNKVAAERKGIKESMEAIRLQAFRRTVQIAGGDADALAPDLHALYLRHRFEDIELYADVRPALDALREVYPLGLLTNGNGYPERCGLPDYFRFAVFSQDLGIEKPDPRIFAVTCKQAGCEPEGLMHVGDSLESDVAGANRAGAISVWLNREHLPNATRIVPDYEITSLTELPTLICRAEKTPRR